MGQNVNAYSYEKNEKVSKLSNLIFELEKIKELKRIRYTTSHPNDMTNDLIKCHKFSKKLVPFVHLPVQSGSNKILKEMNRKHTREEYLNTITELKKQDQKLKFSSDFIVGYPGETEKDFNDTISLINKIKFINSFSFIYNQRPGTPASKQKHIDKETQIERLKILQNLLNIIQLEENNSQIGKSKKVLVENKLKNQESFFGRLDNLTPVIIQNTNKNDVGKIIDVKIKNSNRNNLFGFKENIKNGAAA